MIDTTILTREQRLALCSRWMERYSALSQEGVSDAAQVAASECGVAEGQLREWVAIFLDEAFRAGQIERGVRAVLTEMEATHQRDYRLFLTVGLMALLWGLAIWGVHRAWTEIALILSM